MHDLKLMQSDSQVHIHRKDAAEIVLSSCTEYHYVDGSCKTMDESMGKYFKGAISKTAARCVALAYRSHEIENVPKDEGSLAEWVIRE